MDLRIVNSCNNNCLYCLESSLRKKDKYISKDFLFTQILKEKNKWNITFFWGNPLLHPDILEIIDFCNNNGYTSIWVLSNTSTLDKKLLSDMSSKWLTTFWIYFNSFDKKNHELVNWGGITYESFLENLNTLSVFWINIKIIIHINNLNIDTIARDVLILSKKYWINNFDFVNYFPFDRPYENKEILEYNIIEKRVFIDLLFKLIKKLNLRVNFVKFSKDFFWDFLDFYNYKRWILDQIWEEDVERLWWIEKPFCLEEKRCDKCFIKDNCKYYGI